jgi:DNA-binding protein H-NS
MTKSYAQIIQQIETLKAEAEKLRRKETDGVVERIREAIAHYGLTAEDLGLGKPGAEVAKAAEAGTAPAKKTRRRKGSKPAKAPREVKFRNDAGGTWGGVGKRPQWLRDALAAGKTLQDFAVQ